MSNKTEYTPLYAAPASDADIDGWMELVTETAESFPGLDMKEYAVFLKKSIDRGTALCVRLDEKIAGILLYSPEDRVLGCMAVHPAYRRRGVASALVSEMLRRMPEGDVTVTTFREGDEKGTAPRGLYERLGFEPEELFYEFGYPVQRFVLHRGDHGGKCGEAIKCVS